MHRIALIGLLLTALFAASPAHSKDMAGRFGVGADTSLGYANATQVGSAFPGSPTPLLKLPGLSVVYRATKIFGIQLIFSTHITSGEADLGVTQVPQTILQIGAAMRGHIGVGLSKVANLDAVVGISYVNQGHTIDENPVYDSHNIAIELGIRPEWFVNENLSFHTQVGTAISILNEDSVGFTSGGVHVNIFGAADLLGNAGFTFYF